MSDPMWCCHLTVIDGGGTVHEYYGYGELPSNARDAALNEAGTFAAERDFTFTVIGEHYA